MQMVIYVVMPGGSVYSIAAEYGISAEKIIADNRLTDGNSLAVGQTLVIQIPSQVHTVAAGESLLEIARQYGTTVDALLRNNPELNGKALIYPGQVLTIFLDTQRQGKLAVNGYAYPFIEQGELRRVLPYLTYLTVFTYGIDGEGNLFAPDDTQMIRMAKEYGVAPVMHISSLNAEGYFDNTLSTALLENPDAQSNFIEQVVRVVQEKGYEGVDIDFEFVPAEEAEAYIQLVTELRIAVNALGYEVIVALAPKTSATQRGILYEGHQYQGLGSAADRVLLMTYEWGYTYGPPMAVAPINKVEEVVRYALTEIPPEKIYLGIPAYGYDWILPYQQGRAARSLGPQEAIQLAIGKQAQIEYDYTAQAPYFYYWQGGEQHVVWFEDARSVREKLALAEAYDLYGVAYWNLMRPFPQNWLVLNGNYEIIRK